MAIRLRRIGGRVVAVCAAKTPFSPSDLAYLDDSMHHALMVKFTKDLESEGLLADPPIDEELAQLMAEAEQ